MPTNTAQFTEVLVKPLSKCLLAVSRPKDLLLQAGGLFASRCGIGPWVTCPPEQACITTPKA